jgi:glycosyltransferase involved in cell wall biosynthesis
MTVILIHPTGSQFIRAVLRALAGKDMLKTYFTTINLTGGSRYFGFLPSRIRQELERRVYPSTGGRIVSFPAREIARQLALRFGIKSLTRHETGWACLDRVSESLDRHVARVIRAGIEGSAAVYAYEDCALNAFHAASEKGLKRFYELPIGYWRAGMKIFEEERALQPEWAMTIGGLRDSDEKHRRKDEELRAADHIVVPSEFVRETLSLHPSFAASVDVLPYGAPPVDPAALSGRRPGSKLRVLYVGQLSQRKGLSYLFKAMERLKGRAELTLIGSRPDVACAALTEALARHAWLGAMPHARLMRVMEQHDVLVLPSLFEGFSLVLLEAMSRGLPVITTPNSGAIPTIRDGKEGFIVPIRSADVIAERLNLLADDRSLLWTMSSAALESATRQSWFNYGESYAAMIQNRLGIHR